MAIPRLRDPTDIGSDTSHGSAGITAEFRKISETLELQVLELGNKAKLSYASKEIVKAYKKATQSALLLRDAISELS